MHIKVYFNEKPLFLADSLDSELEALRHQEDTVLIDEFSAAALNSVVHEMHQPRIHAGIFLHPNLEELKKAFYKKFLIIQAAGGLVTNDQEEILFIFRKGKWDLPKGKLDEGEALDECAIRETEEETGVTGVKGGPALLTTYHTYKESGHHILKETHWFKMTVSGVQILKPQLEEQITDIRWISEDSLHEVVRNTYPLIKEVLKKAGYSF